VRVGGVASNARHASGVTILGIDPESEAGISFIGDAVADGRYLEGGETLGILAGRAMVENMETRIGNKLILMSQDAEGEIASRAFRIVGVFQAEMEATEKQFVFITRAAARDMLKLKGGVSEICIRLPSHRTAEKIAAALRSKLPAGDYAVHTWRDLLPVVTATLKMYDGFVLLWYLAVFFAMGFGIVNTILMAVMERIREFGLLKALGMKPAWILGEVLSESFWILLIGIVCGNLLGFLSVYATSWTGIDLSSFAAGVEYFGMPRVIYPAVRGQDVFAANLVVLLLGILVSVYPAVKASRFTPVQAMARV
jgi:ABC-type lipoprotein release transport system permease subunit